MAQVGSTTSAPQGASFATARVENPEGRGSKDLGKDEFLKLLVAQLQNQDPLNPMTDQAFIAQMAQFSALEQMTHVNDTLVKVLGSQRLIEATGMIGKVITAIGADDAPIVGQVTAASVENGVPTVYVGAAKVRLDQVTAVASDSASLPVSSGGANG